MFSAFTGIRSRTGIIFAVLLCSLTMAAGLAQAKEVKFRIAETVQVKDKDLPYTLFVTLKDTGETRLGIDAFLDLRSLQDLAPWLFSSILKETCQQKFALAVSKVSAQANALVADGQVQAKFYACDTEDPKTHYRGVLLFGQNVDVVVKAAAEVKQNCLHLRLQDVDLDLQGFVGTVSDMIGLTEKARLLILEKGAEVLAENPVCPELPGELKGLYPRFTAGGIREIGSDGVGAALSGSVDTSARTLLDLLAVLQENQRFGVVE